jgi:branched-chain amino acid transport system ATP-binding protein
MLEVEGLHVAHGDAEVIHGLGFEVHDGEAIAIIGSNGAGKTTLLRTVCGLMEPTSGSIRYAGADVVGTPTHKLSRLGMAYVPAERHLFPDMTVGENLALGAYPKKPTKASYDQVFGLFPRLAERRSQPAGTMSGGEQQMLAVGRALMGEPVLLMLDEPTTGLAPILAEEAYHALGLLRDAGDTTVVVAEQQVPLALAFANRAYVLEDGQIQLEGTPEEFRDNPDVRRAYLGIA